MHNPWHCLPDTDPFVLESDEQSILSFNDAYSRSATRIHLEIPPEPFLGRRDAPVVLLSLNPGFGTEERAQPPDPAFVQLIRSNLLHHEMEYPFYLLDPQIGGPGYAWWTRKLRWLLQRYDHLHLANSLLCIEYFPYHSHKYHYRTPFVESQRYSFFLVQQAMERNAVIVLMRSPKRWLDAVPALQTYPMMYRLRSAQNVTISPGNCPDGAYEQLIATLNNHINNRLPAAL